MPRRSAHWLPLGTLVLGTLLAISTPGLAHQVESTPSGSPLHAAIREMVATSIPWLAPRQEAAPAGAGRIVSSKIELAREEARLRLETVSGEVFELALKDGEALLNGRSLGAAPRGESLDRAWRELLTAGLDLSTEEFIQRLAEWSPPPGATAEAMTRELSRLAASLSAAGSVGAEPSSDTLATLKQRIAELERRLASESTRSADDQARANQKHHAVTRIEVRRESDPWYSPLRHIGSGIAAILVDLVVLAVLAGIGFAVIFFVRKELEVVADTIRREPVRSGLVGLAATFLALPSYILGIIVLAISIIGIPLLLAWLPLFWVAVGIAALFGYVAAAYAIGEALTERRFYAGEWVDRTNAYYYLMIGLSGLFALYIAGHVVRMAGPLFSFIQVFLLILAGIGTWLAATVGLGAVLLTRAGTRRRARPVSANDAEIDLDDLFEEEPNV